MMQAAAAPEHTEDETVLLAEAITENPAETASPAALKAIIEAAIYITDEPLTAEQIASAVEQPLDARTGGRLQDVNQAGVP